MVTDDYVCVEFIVSCVISELCPYFILTIIQSMDISRFLHYLFIAAFIKHVFFFVMNSLGEKKHLDPSHVPECVYIYAQEDIQINLD